MFFDLFSSAYSSITFPPNIPPIFLLLTNLHPCSIIGHGECSDSGCNCVIPYYGSNCNQSFKCGGLLDTFSTECSSHGHCNGFSENCHCSNHGNCFNEDKCDCFEGYYEDEYQNWNCFDIVMSAENVCNFGICNSHDNCTCPMFYGFNCSQWDCFGIEKSNTSVCNGNSTCLSPNNCGISRGSKDVISTSTICFILILFFLHHLFTI